MQLISIKPKEKIPIIDTVVDSCSYDCSEEITNIETVIDLCRYDGPPLTKVYFKVNESKDTRLQSFIHLMQLNYQYELLTEKYYSGFRDV